jgi:hypothetical protein
MMKRFEGESYEKYRLRRRGTQMIEKAHLKGRLANGMYVDPALHRTMEKTARRRKVLDVMWAVMMAGIIVVVVLIAGYYAGSI